MVLNSIEQWDRYILRSILKSQNKSGIDCHHETRHKKISSSCTSAPKVRI